MGNSVRYKIAAFLGISAFVFPEQPPWPLLASLLSAIVVVCGARGRGRLITMLVSVSLFIGVAGGVLSASFVTGILAAVAIAPHNRLLAIGVLGLQTSYAASLEAIVATHLFSWHLEAAGPALLSGALILALQGRHPWSHTAIALFPLPLVFVAQKLGFSPYGLLVLAGLPAMALALITPSDERRALKGLPLWATSGVVALGAIGWMTTPPKMPDAGYVLLPGEINNPEARFYRNYKEVLRFAGISAQVVETAEEIPPGSLVLLPWLTASVQREGAPSFEQLRELAIKGGWLVVMVGEHTDMGGVATRIKAITGHHYLRNDLSVPLGNADNSGVMRTGDIRAWHPDAMLNRGASVDVLSPLNRVLLSGDGWWAEPNIDEWLWVGDYIWQPSDRHGRLVMAATADEGRARWVILGDTGPFINQQMVSDPRPAARILELASLWPMFVRDVSLVIVASVIALGLPSVLLVGAAGLMVGASLIPWGSNDGAWRSVWRQESAFDERNFNQSLLDSPLLLTTEWKLVRPKEPLSGRIPFPETPTVVFGLVDGELSIGDMKLNNCRRLGSVSTDGILLMDAQACTVVGNAEILVGDNAEAAIMRVGSLLLVLDQNFLGQKSPPGNRSWLETKLNPEESRLTNKRGKFGD